MLWYDNAAILDDCIIDEIKEDRRRWQPIEVLQNGQYSKESDIYMLTMVMYEFYMALQIHQTDPMANQLECAPFSNVANEQILDTLYSGEVPLQPDYCPDWLYDIMKLCWNRDRTRRPTTKWVIEEMTKRLSVNSAKDESEQGIYHTVDDEENYEPLQEDENGPKDYDNLGKADDSSEKNISEEGSKTTPVVSVQGCEYVNMPSKSFFRQNTDSQIIFTCVNSDTESEGSMTRNSRKVDIQTDKSCNSSDSSCSGYFHTEFKCVNSSTSESENEYCNEYHHTDALSCAKLPKDGVKTFTSAEGNTDKDTLNFNISRASSSYFEVETKHPPTQNNHIQTEMHEMQDYENVGKQNKRKRSYCRQRTKTPLKNVVNPEKTVSMKDEDTSSNGSLTSSSNTDISMNSSSSSSYFSCSPGSHTSQRSTCSVIEMPFENSSSNILTNCVDISSNPKCCGARFKTSNKRRNTNKKVEDVEQCSDLGSNSNSNTSHPPSRDSRPADVHENAEEKEQYLDFESNEDPKLFCPPSENLDTEDVEGRDSYLTVYHI